jgi:hypothetical protein
VTAESAQAEVVAALIGGGAIGHARDTMSAASAVQAWQRFASLFAPDRRYFIGMGLGDPGMCFSRARRSSDATRAGYIGVVESD